MAKPKPASPRPARSPAAQGLPTKTYIESSALAAAILESDAAAIASIRQAQLSITSALTITEVHRAILRARLSARITPQQQRAALRALQTFTRRCHIAAITQPILTRAARPFPIEPIRTLDALHLATAESLGDPPALIAILTRDLRIQSNATALGYTVE